MVECIEQEAANQLKAEIQKLNEMLFWINGNESCKLKISDITEMRDSMLNAYYALQEQEKHGKWETITNPDGNIEGWLHKECGRQVTSKDAYCPNCGAKMDS